MEKATLVLGRREVLKLLIKAKISRVPTLVWVKPNTKELRTFNVET